MARRLLINSAMRKTPKIDALAEQLEISRAAALGHLISLFQTVNMAREGVILAVAVELAEAAGWEGDAQEFRKALFASGWLEPVNDSLLLLRIVDYGTLVRIEKA